MEWKAEEDSLGDGVKRSRLLTILCLVSFSISLTAQMNYVALGGTIMDPQHLAIPYASVKLTSVATAEERKVTANAHGVYEIGPLLPGAYLLVAESKGFAVAQRSLQLEVGQQVTLDVTLIGAGTRPMDNKKVIGFSATGTFPRSDYGLQNLLAK